MSAAAAGSHNNYQDPAVAGWLTSRAAVEALFARRTGDAVPTDYIARFEAWLNADGYLSSNGEAWTHVMMCDARVFPEQDCVLLRKYIVRPCAEGLGLTRLLFARLLRYCHYHNYDLQIDTPSAATALFLQTVARIPAHIVHETGMGAFGTRFYAIDHVRIPHRFMVGALHGLRCDMVRRFTGAATSAILDGPYDDFDLAPAAAPLRLPPALFPSADALSLPSA